MSLRRAARGGALLLVLAQALAVAHGQLSTVALRLPEALVVLVVAYAAWTATRAGILAGLIVAAVEFFRAIPGLLLLGPAVAETAGYGAATVLLGWAVQRTEAGIPRSPPVPGLELARVLMGAQLVASAVAFGLGMALLATELTGRVPPPATPALVNAGALLTPILAIALVVLRHPSWRRLWLGALAQAAWVVIVVTNALALDSPAVIVFALLSAAGILAILVRPLISRS